MLICVHGMGREVGAPGGTLGLAQTAGTSAQETADLLMQVRVRAVCSQSKVGPERSSVLGRERSG